MNETIPVIASEKELTAEMMEELTNGKGDDE
nr:MAG TPA: hypothetical protein [Bacteriophage sp.]